MCHVQFIPNLHPRPLPKHVQVPENEKKKINKQKTHGLCFSMFANEMQCQLSVYPRCTRNWLRKRENTLLHNGSGETEINKGRTRFRALLEPGPPDH